MTTFSVDGDIASVAIASLQETSYGLEVTGYGAAAVLWPAAAPLTFSSEAVAPLIPLDPWAAGAEAGDGQIWITGQEGHRPTEDVDLDGPATPQPRLLDPLTGLGVESQPFATTKAAEELLILDAGVAEPERLLEGLRPGIEVVRLSADRDGIAQISEVLAGRSGLRALHVLAHGEEASLSLGSTTMSLTSLPESTAMLRQWRAAMVEGWDLLFYGCDVGAGEEGQRFLAEVSHLTGADVAGSDDATGSQLLGGDWNLEVATGRVEVLAPFPGNEYGRLLANELAPDTITDQDWRPDAYVTKPGEQTLTIEDNANSITDYVLKKGAAQPVSLVVSRSNAPADGGVLTLQITDRIVLEARGKNKISVQNKEEAATLTALSNGALSLVWGGKNIRLEKFTTITFDGEYDLVIDNSYGPNKIVTVGQDVQLGDGQSPITVTGKYRNVTSKVNNLTIKVNDNTISEGILMANEAGNKIEFTGVSSILVDLNKGELKKVPTGAQPTALFTEVSGVQDFSGSPSQGTFTIIGSDQANQLKGGGQNDTIDGGKGGDTLIGGNGNNTYDGGKGDDTLIGGNGNNTYIFQKGWNKDIVENTINGKLDFSKYQGVPDDKLQITLDQLGITATTSFGDELQGQAGSGVSRITEILGTEGITYIVKNDHKEHVTLYNTKTDAANTPLNAILDFSDWKKGRTFVISQKPGYLEVKAYDGAKDSLQILTATGVRKIIGSNSNDTYTYIFDTYETLEKIELNLSGSTTSVISFEDAQASVFFNTTANQVPRKLLEIDTSALQKGAVETKQTHVLYIPPGTTPKLEAYLSSGEILGEVTLESPQPGASPSSAIKDAFDQLLKKYKPRVVFDVEAEDYVQGVQNGKFRVEVGITKNSKGETRTLGLIPEAKDLADLDQYYANLNDDLFLVRVKADAVIAAEKPTITRDVTNKDKWEIKIDNSDPNSGNPKKVPDQSGYKLQYSDAIVKQLSPTILYSDTEAEITRKLKGLEVLGYLTISNVGIVNGNGANQHDKTITVEVSNGPTGGYDLAILQTDDLLSSCVTTPITKPKDYVVSLVKSGDEEIKQIKLSLTLDVQGVKDLTITANGTTLDWKNEVEDLLKKQLESNGVDKTISAKVTGEGSKANPYKISFTSYQYTINRVDLQVTQPNLNDVNIAAGENNSRLEFAEFKGSEKSDFIQLDNKKYTVHGKDGNDLIIGSSNDDTLKGDAGDDYIQSKSGADSIDGGAGNDWLEGGDSNDTIVGGDGNDSLQGGDDDDSLNGGSGDDTLSGGQGNDTLKGGAGDDTYIFENNWGKDTLEEVDDGKGLLGSALTPKNKLDFSKVNKDIAPNNVNIRKVLFVLSDNKLNVRSYEERSEDITNTTKYLVVPQESLKGAKFSSGSIGLNPNAQFLETLSTQDSASLRNVGTIVAPNTDSSFLFGNEWGTSEATAGSKIAGALSGFVGDQNLYNAFVNENQKLKIDTEKMFKNNNLIIDFRACTHELEFSFKYKGDHVELSVKRGATLEIPIYGPKFGSFSFNEIVFTHVGANTLVYGGRNKNSFKMDSTVQQYGMLGPLTNANAPNFYEGKLIGGEGNRIGDLTKSSVGSIFRNILFDGNISFSGLTKRAEAIVRGDFLPPLNVVNTVDLSSSTFFANLFSLVQNKFSVNNPTAGSNFQGILDFVNLGADSRVFAASLLPLVGAQLKRWDTNVAGGVSDVLGPALLGASLFSIIRPRSSGSQNSIASLANNFNFGISSLLPGNYRNIGNVNLGNSIDLVIGRDIDASFISNKSYNTLDKIWNIFTGLVDGLGADTITVGSSASSVTNLTTALRSGINAVSKTRSPKPGDRYKAGYKVLKSLTKALIGDYNGVGAHVLVGMSGGDTYKFNGSWGTSAVLDLPDPFKILGDDTLDLSGVKGEIEIDIYPINKTSNYLVVKAKTPNSIATADIPGLSNILKDTFTNFLFATDIENIVAGKNKTTIRFHGNPKDYPLDSFLSGYISSGGGPIQLDYSEAKFDKETGVTTDLNGLGTWELFPQMTDKDAWFWSLPGVYVGYGSATGIAGSARTPVVDIISRLITDIAPDSNKDSINLLKDIAISSVTSIRDSHRNDTLIGRGADKTSFLWRDLFKGYDWADPSKRPELYDDTFILGQGGNDTVDGKEGNDTLDFSKYSSGITIERDTNPNSIYEFVARNKHGSSNLLTANFKNIEKVVGSAGDDSITLLEGMTYQVTNDWGGKDSVTNGIIDLTSFTGPITINRNTVDGKTTFKITSDSREIELINIKEILYNKNNQPTREGNAIDSVNGIINSNGSDPAFNFKKFLSGGGVRTLLANHQQPLSGDVRIISDQDLTPLVQEAVRRWQQSGFTELSPINLNDISISLLDLPEGTLGQAIGDVIYIDPDASGFGWYLDPNPEDDAEFDIGGSYTSPNSPASGRFDLLNVLLHELGHAVGFPDLQDSPELLMNQELQTGRRNPIPQYTPEFLQQNFTSLSSQNGLIQASEPTDRDKLVTGLNDFANWAATYGDTLRNQILSGLPKIPFSDKALDSLWNATGQSITAKVAASIRDQVAAVFNRKEQVTTGDIFALDFISPTLSSEDKRFKASIPLATFTQPIKLDLRSSFLSDLGFKDLPLNVSQSSPIVLSTDLALSFVFGIDQAGSFYVEDPTLSGDLKLDSEGLFDLSLNLGPIGIGIKEGNVFLTTGFNVDAAGRYFTEDFTLGADNQITMRLGDPKINANSSYELELPIRLLGALDGLNDSDDSPIIRGSYNTAANPAPVDGKTVSQFLSSLATFSSAENITGLLKVKEVSLDALLDGLKSGLTNIIDKDGIAYKDIPLLNKRIVDVLGSQSTDFVAGIIKAIDVVKGGLSNMQMLQIDLNSEINRQLNLNLDIDALSLKAAFNRLTNVAVELDGGSTDSELAVALAQLDQGENYSLLANARDVVAANDRLVAKGLTKTSTDQEIKLLSVDPAQYDLIRQYRNTVASRTDLAAALDQLNTRGLTATSTDEEIANVIDVSSSTAILPDLIKVANGTFASQTESDSFGPLYEILVSQAKQYLAKFGLSGSSSQADVDAEFNQDTLLAELKAARNMLAAAPQDWRTALQGLESLGLSAQSSDNLISSSLASDSANSLISDRDYLIASEQLLGVTSEDAIKQLKLYSLSTDSTDEAIALKLVDPTKLDALKADRDQLAKFDDIKIVGLAYRDSKFDVDLNIENISYKGQQNFDLDLASLAQLEGIPEDVRSLFAGAANLGLDVGASGYVDVDAQASLNLGLNFDLSNVLDPKLYVNDNSSFDFKLKLLTLSPVDFNASLKVDGRPLGFWVKDGTADIDLKGNLSLKRNAEGRYLSSSISKENSNIYVDGYAKVDLPLYFPIEELPMGGSDKDLNLDGIPDNRLHLDATFANGGLKNIQFELPNLVSASDLFALLNDPDSIIKGLEGLFDVLDQGTKAAANVPLPLIGEVLGSNITFFQDRKLELLGTASNPSGFRRSLQSPKLTIEAIQEGTLTTREQQRIFSDGRPGTFQLAYNNNQTALIDSDSSAAALEVALEKLSGVGDINVTGAGTSLAPWLITFLSNGDRPLISQAKKTTIEIIQDGIYDTLGAYLSLSDINKDGRTDALDVPITLSQDSIQFNLPMSGRLGQFTLPIDFNASVPGLGLDLLPGSEIIIDLLYDFELGFGFNSKQGLYLDTSGALPSGEELAIRLQATLANGFKAEAKLGFLKVELSEISKGSKLDNDSVNSGIFGTLGIDLRDPNNDGRLLLSSNSRYGAKSELAQALQNIRSSVVGTLKAEANVDLYAAVNLKGLGTTSVSLPEITTILRYDQLFVNASTAKAARNSFGNAPSVVFENVTLDLGSFLSTLAGPVVDTIKPFIDPVEDVVRFIAKPINLGFADFRILDLARLRLTPSQFRDLEKAVGSILSFTSFVDTLNTAKSETIKVDFGKFILSKDLLSNKSATVDQSAAGKKKPDLAAQTNDNPKASNFTKKIGTTPGSIEFPLLQDPASILGLLTGRDADLFRFDMPDLDLGLGYRQSFPLFPGLNAVLSGNINAKTDLSFGFTSAGIRAWAEEEDFKASEIDRILEGLYVDDWTKDALNAISKDQAYNPTINYQKTEDYDKSELIFTMDISAGASLGISGLVEGGVNGGLSAQIRFDLNDIKQPGKTYGDGKLTIDEISQRLQQSPFALFNSSGDLRAFLEAYFWVGINILGFKTTIYEARKRFVDEVLASYNYSFPDPIPADAADLDSSGVLTLRYLPSGAQSQPNDAAVNYDVSLLSRDATQAGLRYEKGKFIKVIGNGVVEYFNVENVKKIKALGTSLNDSYNIHDLGTNKIDVEISGAGGDDSIMIADTAGAVVADGNDGKDMLLVKNIKGSISLNGGVGNDALEVDVRALNHDQSIEVLGGDEDDTLVVYSNTSTATRTLKGQAGNDRLLGGDSKDRLEGGDGDDVMLGGAGDDQLLGGTGADILSGGEGMDTLDGGSGNDRLYGEAGDDELLGGEGNDVLLGGEGKDKVSGNAGDDLLEWRSGDGIDLVVDGNDGKDEISLLASQRNQDGSAFDAGIADVVSILSNGPSDRTIWNGQILDFSNFESLSLDTGKGADQITINDLSSSRLHSITLSPGSQSQVISENRSRFYPTGSYVTVKEWVDLSALPDSWLLDEEDTQANLLNVSNANTSEQKTWVVLERKDSQRLVQRELFVDQGTTLEEIYEIETRVPDTSADRVYLSGSGANDQITVSSLKEQDDATGEERPVLQIAIASGSEPSRLIRLNYAGALQNNSPSDVVIVDGAAGNDTISAAGMDPNLLAIDELRLLGGAGDDAITGSPLSEVIIGGSGSDSISGGLGVDRFRHPEHPESSDTAVDILSEEHDRDFALSDASLHIGTLNSDGSPATGETEDIEGIFEKVILRGGLSLNRFRVLQFSGSVELDGNGSSDQYTILPSMAPGSEIDITEANPPTNASTQSEQDVLVILGTDEDESFDFGLDGLRPVVQYGRLQGSAAQKISYLPVETLQISAGDGSDRFWASDRGDSKTLSGLFVADSSKITILDGGLGMDEIYYDFIDSPASVNSSTRHSLLSKRNFIIGSTETLVIDNRLNSNPVNWMLESDQLLVGSTDNDYIPLLWTDVFTSVDLLTAKGSDMREKDKLIVSEAAKLARITANGNSIAITSGINLVSDAQFAIVNPIATSESIPPFEAGSTIIRSGFITQFDTTNLSVSSLDPNSYTATISPDGNVTQFRFDGDLVIEEGAKIKGLGSRGLSILAFGNIIFEGTAELDVSASWELGYGESGSGRTPGPGGGLGGSGATILLDPLTFYGPESGQPGINYGALYYNQVASTPLSSDADFRVLASGGRGKISLNSSSSLKGGGGGGGSRIGYPDNPEFLDGIGQYGGNVSSGAGGAGGGALELIALGQITRLNQTEPLTFRAFGGKGESVTSEYPAGLIVAGGSGGAGGMIKLSASSFDLGSTSFTTSGGLGGLGKTGFNYSLQTYVFGESGEDGTYEIASNAYPSIDVPSGIKLPITSGFKASNPYLSAPALTPFIPNLRHGSEAFGLTNIELSDLNLSNPPNGAVAAVYRMEIGPDLYATDFKDVSTLKDYDLLLFFNISDHALANPALGVNLDNSPFFRVSPLANGGSLPQFIDSFNPAIVNRELNYLPHLHSGEVWATLIPGDSSSIIINARIDGYADASQAIASGELFYIDQNLGLSDLILASDMPSSDGKNYIYAVDGRNSLYVINNVTNVVSQKLQNGFGSVHGLNGARLIARAHDGQSVLVYGDNDRQIAVFVPSNSGSELHFQKAIDLHSILGDSRTLSTLSVVDSGIVVSVQNRSDTLLTEMTDAAVFLLDYNGSILASHSTSTPAAYKSYHISGDGMYIYGLRSTDQTLEIIRASDLNLIQTVDAELLPLLKDASCIFVANDYAYIASSSQNSLVVLRRNIDGSLDSNPVQWLREGSAGVRGIAGANRLILATIADEEYFYLLSSSAETLAVFLRDQVTGELTLQQVLRGIESLSRSTNIVVDHSGNAYVSSLATRSASGGITKFQGNSSLDKSTPLLLEFNGLQALEIVTGSQDDFVSQIGAPIPVGSILIDSGAGSDSISLSHLRGSSVLAITSGPGADIITLGDPDETSILSTLNLDSGAGDDRLNLTNLSALNAGLPASLQIASGDGADAVALQGVQAEVQTGSGDDRISIQSGEVANRLTVQSETGNDRLQIFNASASDSILLEGGAGDDEFVVAGRLIEGDSSSSQLVIDGQDGSNTLFFDAGGASILSFDANGNSVAAPVTPAGTLQVESQIDGVSTRSLDYRSIQSIPGITGTSALISTPVSSVEGAAVQLQATITPGTGRTIQSARWFINGTELTTVSADDLVLHGNTITLDTPVAWADLFTKGFGRFGTYLISLEVRDDLLGAVVRDSQRLEIVNQLPSVSILNASPIIVDEGAATVLFKGIFSDPGDDDFTVDWDFGDQSSRRGLLQVAHTYARSGSYTASFSVSDGSDSSSIATKQVTVNNLPPSISVTSTSISVQEGQQASNGGAVSDPGNDAITLSASIGSIGRTPEGGWNWSHLAADGPDVYDVIVTATDEDGAASSVVFRVSVLNRAPSLTLFGPSTVEEGSPYSLTLGPIGDAGLDQISALEINWDDGSIETLNPALLPADRILTHRFGDGDRDYLIAISLVDEDGRFERAATKTITVLNQTPVVTLSTTALSVNRGAPASLTFRLADPGLEPSPPQLTATVRQATASARGEGQFQLASEASPLGTITDNADGSWTWLLADTSGLRDAQTVTISATDAGGAEGTASFSLTLLNQAPQITSVDLPLELQEGQEGTFRATATDPNGDALTYLWDFGPGQAIRSGGSVSYAYRNNLPGNAPYEIRLTVQDPSGASDSTTRSILITNAAPTLSADRSQLSVDEGSAASNSGRFSDPGSDSITLSASFGTVTAEAGGVWSWRADAGNGPASRQVTITAQDSDGATTSVGFALETRNLSPTLSVQVPSITILQGELATNAGSFEDPGQDPVTLTSSIGEVREDGPGRWAWTFDSATRSLPQQRVFITATDQDGTTSTTSFELIVSNLAPILSVVQSSVAISEGATASTSGICRDPGGDPLTLSASVGSVSLLDDGSWTWSFTSADGPNQSQTVTVTATDARGATSTVSFALIVNNVAPTLQLDASTVTVQEGAIATNRGSVQDPSLDLVGLKASVGTVTLNADRTWLWSLPTTDGPDQSQRVTLTATDSDGASTSQSFELVVTNVIPQIQVAQTRVTFNEGDEAVNTGTFSDPGADSLRFSASVGNITALADGTWRWSYTCPDGPSASQTVIVTVTDSDGASSQASFDLVIRNVAPTVDAGSDVSLVAGVPFRFQGRFIDPGILDTHTIRWDFGDGNTASGTLQPIYSYLMPGAYTATLTITDRDGEKSSGSLAVRALPATTPDRTSGPLPAAPSAPTPALLAPRVNDIEAGTFVVGSQGLVTVDFLADFGAYQSELGLFSLEGMEAFRPGSVDFIREAVRRVLSGSELGSLLYSQYSEGARLRGELGEQDRNLNGYVAPRSNRFAPGSRIAFVLIPNGTFRQVFSDPASEGDRRPLFSIASANPGQFAQFGKLVTETRDGAVFGFEDIRHDTGTDADYNDFLIQVNGASAMTPALASLIDPSRFWLELTLGRQLTTLATGRDSTSDQGPDIISLSLLNDTGFSATDRLSRDVTLVGQISSLYAISSLQARLGEGGILRDVSQALSADGSFRLDKAELEAINGGPLPDGFHTLTLVATDVWDQASQFVSLSFIKDTQAPGAAAFVTVSELHSLSPALIGETEVGSRLLLHQQGLPPFEAVSPGLWEARLNDLASGAISQTISITDAAGNQGQDAVHTWNFDSNAPLLTLLSPTRYQVLTSSSRLIGRVEDPVKSFDKLEIQFNSGTRRTVLTAADNSFDEPIDLSDLTPGFHTLTLHLTFGGGKSYSLSQMVTI